MAEPDPEFTVYVAANWERLRRTAFLLCGDWHRAEDLTQDAFTNPCVHWNRAKAARNLDHSGIGTSGNFRSWLRLHQGPTS